MTNQDHREDDQWLAALSGNPDPQADTQVNRQAAALRQALQEQEKALDSITQKADDALYQQILFRLRRERLLDTTQSNDQLEAIRFSRKDGDEGISHPKTKPQTLFRPAYWGLAASLLLGTILVLQTGLLDREDGELAVRGDRHATVLIVQDPKSRSTELLAGLKAAGAAPTLDTLPSGRIKITVKTSNAVVDYLMLERITPMIKDEQIILILDPAPK